MIKFGRIATAVLSGSTCASACFIVFAAGNERYAHYSSRVGVHGASDERGQETIQSGAATVTMARVVRDLGVPSSIVGKLVVTPPTDMVWLTVDDFRAMNVTMLGKPTQVPPDQQVLERAPQVIAPGAQAVAPPNPRPTWEKMLAGAIEISKEQNNGRARYGRSCQPEMKVCTTGVWFKAKNGTEMFLRLEENLQGVIVRRDVCSINDFGDVRTCVDWDTNRTRKAMKNNKGEWIGVDD